MGREVVPLYFVLAAKKADARKNAGQANSPGLLSHSPLPCHSLLLRRTYISCQTTKQPEKHLDRSQKELSSFHLHSLIFPRVEPKPLNNRWCNLCGRYSVHTLAGDEISNIPVLIVCHTRLVRVSFPTHRRLKSVKINAGRVKLCSSSVQDQPERLFLRRP
jgi:hypothetical protein